MREGQGYPCWWHDDDDDEQNRIKSEGGTYLDMCIVNDKNFKGETSRSTKKRINEQIQDFKIDDVKFVKDMYASLPRHIEAIVIRKGSYTKSWQWNENYV